MESGNGPDMKSAGEKPINLLLVEDDDEFRETCAMWMSRKGHAVAEAADAHEALQLCQQKHFDVAVVDLNMPGMNGLELLDRLREDNIEMQVLMLTGQASVDSAVQAMKLGAYDYLSKPFPLPELEKRCRLAFERGCLQKENQQLKAVIERTRPVVKMIGNSQPMQQVHRLIERAGPTDKAILIQGESGTGKELVARGLQVCSLRADRPFVTINCAALPEQLVESELFGHEKGSFTGATATKPGLFEVADGGTIFIDEIGEMPLSLQPKLLRVLEDGSLRRVGSHKERRVNVRLIAATNRNLGDMAAEGKFREDLYYRINVLTIELAPLREREGDVDLLIDHFLGKDWKISQETRDIMRAYHWPGNVRQLINVIERATILAEDGCVQVCDLPKEVTGGTAERSAGAASALPSSEKLEDLERAHVLQVLHSHDGNKARAARALGIHRRKLYRLLERFDIRPEEYA
ncbi:MAG: sigma-54-dependent transcriptional regulator [Planctomycetota bacterium]|jgi:DNA-binding NtrC family response regulator